MGISNAIDPGSVARTLGVQTIFKDLRGASTLFLPQRIAVVGQGNTASTFSTTKKQFTKAYDVGVAYGFGSPIHLAARQLFPVFGNGVGTIPVTFYPLTDDVSGVASVGDITATVAATKAGVYKIVVNNIESLSFTINIGDTQGDVNTKMINAVNAVLDMPVTAVLNVLKVDFTSKWEGASANDLYIAVEGPTTYGVTFAITQPVGGLNNPDVDTALNQIGDIWETLVLNCLDVADTASLDKYQTFGDSRWGALTRKPLVVFTGNNATSVATAITVSNARKTDKINSQLVCPGSNELPFVSAARQLAKIAVVANENPPQDYGSQLATGLVPGSDGDQWDYSDKDTAVKGGSSTIDVRAGVVSLSDIVTFYHPDGDPQPAYRHVVDIIKLQNCIFNLNLIFNQPEWDGAPLIPDNQATINPLAKRPKTAKAVVASMLDGLGMDAIISDPETAKKNIQAEIDPGNPKRLNLVVTVQLSGNTNLISVDLEFGFFFG